MLIWMKFFFCSFLIENWHICGYKVSGKIIGRISGQLYGLDLILYLIVKVFVENVPEPDHHLVGVMETAIVAGVPP